MKNIFCFVEIPVNNMDRAIGFYNKILELDIVSQKFEGLDMAFFPNEQGMVSGALIKNNDYTPGAQGPLVYIDGNNDLIHILNKVEDAGGRILLNKTKISENHYYAMFMDTEGNRLALYSRN